MRKRPGVLYALLLFTLGGAPYSGHAQTISGTVIDDLGAAVPNARVSLRLPDGEVASKTTAGADGVFVLQVPESGEYHLAADATGHLPLNSRLLAIDATRSFELDLQLNRAAAEMVEHEVPLERYEEWVRKFVRDWRTRQVVVVPGPEWHPLPPRVGPVPQRAAASPRHRGRRGGRPHLPRSRRVERTDPGRRHELERAPGERSDHTLPRGVSSPVRSLSTGRGP